MWLQCIILYKLAIHQLLNKWAVLEISKFSSLFLDGLDHPSVVPDCHIIIYNRQQLFGFVWEPTRLLAVSYAIHFIQACNHKTTGAYVDTILKYVQHQPQVSIPRTSSIVGTPSYSGATIIIASYSVDTFWRVQVKQVIAQMSYNHVGIITVFTWEQSVVVHGYNFILLILLVSVNDTILLLMQA